VAVPGQVLGRITEDVGGFLHFTHYCAVDQRGGRWVIGALGGREAKRLYGMSGTEGYRTIADDIAPRVFGYDEERGPFG
jgi:hypothetical protein